MDDPGPLSDDGFVERVLEGADATRRDELLVALAAERGLSPAAIASLTGLDRRVVQQSLEDRDTDHSAADAPAEPAFAETIRELATAESHERIAEILTAVARTNFGTRTVVVYRYDGVRNELVPELTTTERGDDHEPAPISQGSDPLWSVFRTEAPAALDGDVVVPARALGVVRFVGTDLDRIPDDALGMLGPVASVAVGVLDRQRRIRRLEADLDELAAENERLEEFASIVSHDLRNPLSVAEGNLELAAETGEREHFEKVEAAHDRIERIIEHTLSVSAEGHRADDVETIDLESVARAAWRTVDTTRGRLSVAGTMALAADPERVQQLFENLFRNAIEHGVSEGTDGNPAVTITVGPLDCDGFVIADDGPGIPEDERSLIFERGYTSEDDGTGFGLYIAKEIVDGHRWEISVTESDSGGARFEVTGVD